MAYHRISHVGKPYFHKDGLLWKGWQAATIDDLPHIFKAKAFTYKRMRRKLLRAVWFDPVVPQ